MYNVPFSMIYHPYHVRVKNTSTCDVSSALMQPLNNLLIGFYNLAICPKCIKNSSVGKLYHDPC